MKKVHILILLVIAAAVITITSAIGNTSEYVDFATAAKHPERKFHVVGEWVKEKGYTYDPLKDPNHFAFYMKDTLGAVEQVILKSNKPQDFEHSEKVVIVGAMGKEHFEASSILMKCPSKYDDENSLKTSENLER